MQSRRFSRVRRPAGGRAPRFLIKLSFLNFVWLGLLLALLILLTQIYIHTQILLPQGRRQDCEWLSHPPLVCAHGGDSSKAPPNTDLLVILCDECRRTHQEAHIGEAAYHLALEMQVDCMEIDASRTCDGVLVALHDRFKGKIRVNAYTLKGRDLQAMSGNRYTHVGNLNFSQIKELNPGARFPEKFQKQHVPTLEAALQYVAPHVKQVIIDAKVGPPNYEDEMASDLFSVMKNVDCRNCVMWAKADSVVKDFIRLSADPGSIGYIVMKDKVTGKVANPLRMEGASVVGAFHGIVTTKLVNTVHRAGKKLHAWTVDEEPVMMHMLRTGVDGLVTSVPSLLQRVMGSERQQCAVNGFS